MKDRYITTVDLGTGKIAVSVAKVTGDNTQILYYREVPSDGVRYGRIFNPVKASVPLKQAISDAENELGIKITQVVVGLPRYGVRQETAFAETQRSDPGSCITQEEIDGVKDMALDTYPLDDEDHEEMYGAVAQSFSTEDALNYSEEDVVGMPSSSLQGNFKVFVGNKKAVSNINILLNNAGVAEANRYFLPRATADAVLTGEEKENGVALIEMGAGVTSVTIFQDNILRYYYAIPFGGKSITTDIRLECAFDDTLAENIKLAFGACLPEKLQTMSDKVLQINDEENGTYEHLSIKYLSEIITSRCREIVQAILFAIQESGFADRLRCGIVLTGGGANLANLTNLIKEESGYNVRVGFPLARKFSSEGCPGIGEAEASASVGMILEASSDPYLNCISEVPKPQEKAEPVEYPEAEANGQGRLFAADDFDKAMQAKIKKTPGEKKKKRDATKPAKPAKPGSDKPSGFKVFWTTMGQKVGSVLEKGFEGTLAGFYDNMDKE